MTDATDDTTAPPPAPPSHVVRAAGGGDVEAARALLQRFFDEEGFDVSPLRVGTALASMLEGSDAAVFVAWREGEAVGVATVAIVMSLEYGRVAEIGDVFVPAEHRSHGIAGDLLETAAQWAGQRGCGAINVVVTPGGDQAHELTAFYRRRGFENTHRTLLERKLT
jgi:GNAT superfamily N-acetyltransferase